MFCAHVHGWVPRLTGLSRCDRLRRRLAGDYEIMLALLKNQANNCTYLRRACWQRLPSSYCIRRDLETFREAAVQKVVADALRQNAWDFWTSLEPLPKVFDSFTSTTSLSDLVTDYVTYVYAYFCGFWIALICHLAISIVCYPCAENCLLTTSLHDASGPSRALRLRVSRISWRIVRSTETVMVESLSVRTLRYHPRL